MRQLLTYRLTRLQNAPPVVGRSIGTEDRAKTTVPVSVPKSFGEHAGRDGGVDQFVDVLDLDAVEHLVLDVERRLSRLDDTVECHFVPSATAVGTETATSASVRPA